MEPSLTSSNELPRTSQEALSLHDHEVDVALQKALEVSRSKYEQDQHSAQDPFAEKLGALTVGVSRAPEAQSTKEEVFNALDSKQIQACGEGVERLRSLYALAA